MLAGEFAVASGWFTCMVTVSAPCRHSIIACGAHRAVSSSPSALAAMGLLLSFRIISHLTAEARSQQGLLGSCRHHP